MNAESKIMLLILFQLQNGHRKLSEFTGGVFWDCFIWELKLDVDGGHSLKNKVNLNMFIFEDDGCICWDVNNRDFKPFPILDYISFEDNI